MYVVYRMTLKHIREEKQNLSRMSILIMMVLLIRCVRMCFIWYVHVRYDKYICTCTIEIYRYIAKCNVFRYQAIFSYYSIFGCILYLMCVNHSH